MNLLSKVYNKMLDIYNNISEKFYKTTYYWETYWEYDLEEGTAYCSISKGTLYITLSDYRMLENDKVGKRILIELKTQQVPIKVLI